MRTINCFRFILFETFDNLFEGIDAILESRKIIHAVPNSNTTMRMICYM